MKTLHTFRVVDETEYQSDKIHPEVDMKINSEASIDDMIQAFERFLQAVGYVLPENSYLDFTEDSINHNRIEAHQGEF